MSDFKKGKKNINWKGGKARLNCKRCQKEFLVFPYRRNTAEYCSNSCSKKGQTAWAKGTKGILKANKTSFKKGLIPWNKGVKYSKEQKKKLDISGLKKGHGWNYQGMGSISKLQREKFRREIQKIVLERDNYTCQMCKEKGVYLHVDHIQPWNEYVEGRFDINNCRTLCRKCHYKITFGRDMPVNSKWGMKFRKETYISG